MKKVKLLMLGVASVLLLQACEKDGATKDQEKAKESYQQIQQHLATNNINAQEDPEGFFYVIKPGATRGRKPENTGDQLTVHYIGRLLNGTIFDRSEEASPLRYGYNDATIIPGFNMGLGLMSKGDTADIYLPSNLAFGNRAMTGVPAYSPVWFQLVLQEVVTEDQALRDYIAAKKLVNADSSLVSGTPIQIELQGGNSETHVLYRVTTKEGTTAIDRTKQNRVTVNYRGFRLDGTEFDKGTSVSFDLLEGRLIKGFLEGMLEMKVGEKALLLMPSGLGYREKGSNGIRPYTPLIFEVELLKVVE